MAEHLIVHCRQHEVYGPHLRRAAGGRVYLSDTEADHDVAPAHSAWASFIIAHGRCDPPLELVHEDHLPPGV